MSLELLIALYLGGLVGCYFVGLKFGVAVRYIKNLGTNA